MRASRLLILVVALEAGCSSDLDGWANGERAGHTLAMESPDVSSWVGTWAASPVSCGAGLGLNRQTLRQIVHTSIGGTAARIQISNVFGSQPLTVSDVHIARRTSGSTIDTSTDRKVSFGGQSSTMIAAGATGISDSVDFAVAALSDVAISIYFPQKAGNETCHGTGLQTNYIASGDASGSATLNGAQTTGQYHFLVNLDIQNAGAAGALVLLGASITDGVASSQDANRRWPNDLAVRLVNAGYTVGVLNQGISGNQLLVDGSGQSALHRFPRDVAAQPGVKWVIFADDPINDLGDSHPTGAQLIAGAKQLMAMAHQSGIKFLCATLTPFQGANYWSATEETGREQYDAFVRGASSGCDGVVDMDDATHDPANPTKYLPAYNSGDNLHPNTAGLQAMANAVDLTLFAAGAPPGDDGGSQDASEAAVGEPEAGAGSSAGSSGGVSLEAGSGSGSGSTGSGGSSDASGGNGSSSGGGGSGSSTSGGGMVGGTNWGPDGAAASGSSSGGSGGDAMAYPSYPSANTGESSGCSAAPSKATPRSGAALAALSASLGIARRRRRRRGTATFAW